MAIVSVFSYGPSKSRCLGRPVLLLSPGSAQAALLALPAAVCQASLQLLGASVSLQTPPPGSLPSCPHLPRRCNCCQYALLNFRAILYPIAVTTLEDSRAVSYTHVTHGRHPILIVWLMLAAAVSCPTGTVPPLACLHHFIFQNVRRGLLLFPPPSPSLPLLFL